MVKTIHDVYAMAQTGVGWIEDGSQTLLGRAGNGPNGEKVYDHNPETGETSNSLGMPGVGMDLLEPELDERADIAHGHNKQYILNVAPVSDDPAGETPELVSRGYSHDVDAVLVNAGCPNVIVEGGRHELLSRNPSSLGRTLFALKDDLYVPKPVFLRISPQESFSQAMEITRVIRDSGVVSAVYVPNTWPGFVPVGKTGEPILQVPDGVGGKSGPAMAVAAAVQTAWVLKGLEGSGIDVVSSSGIMNGHELGRRMGQGAVAGCGTTFYYEPKDGWQSDTDRLLNELAV